MNPRHRVLKDSSPNARADRLALQAGNYARAVKAGIPHDPREVADILQEARGLLDAITEDNPNPALCTCGVGERDMAHSPGCRRTRMAEYNSEDAP